MAQQQTIGTHCTSVDFSPMFRILSVKYHGTEVVKVSPGQKKIILDTGGWFTNTTKTRMNQASNQFNLGYTVYQKNKQWFTDYKGETYAFNGDICELPLND